MSFQLGVTHWLVLIFSIVFVGYNLLKYKKRLFKKDKFVLLLFLNLVVIFIIYLMTNYSHFFWENIIFLRKIQHPWRLLFIPAIFIPIICAEILDLVKNITLKRLILFSLIVFSIYFNRNYLRPMGSVRYQDEHYFSNEGLLYGSSDISWEFLPVEARQPKFLSKQVIDESLVDDETQIRQKISENMTFNIFVPHDQIIVINIIDFVSWEVFVDGLKQEKNISDDGLIMVFIKEGNHVLEIKLKQSNIELFGNAVSLLSVLILIVVFPIWNRESN